MSFAAELNAAPTQETRRGRPEALTKEERVLLNDLFAERDRLRKQHARIGLQLQALTDTALAEKFETCQQTMSNYSREYRKTIPLRAGN